MRADFLKFQYDNNVLCCLVVSVKLLHETNTIACIMEWPSEVKQRCLKLEAEQANVLLCTERSVLENSEELSTAANSRLLMSETHEENDHTDTLLDEWNPGNDKYRDEWCQQGKMKSTRQVKRRIEPPRKT